MAPSPVLRLPLAALSWEATIFIMPFLEVAAIRSVLLLVIHMIVTAFSIVVPPVVMVVVIIRFYGGNRDQQAACQQERTQVTFHFVFILLNVRNVF
jgi:hypothetical protein